MAVKAKLKARPKTKPNSKRNTPSKNTRRSRSSKRQTKTQAVTATQPVVISKPKRFSLRRRREAAQEIKRMPNAFRIFIKAGQHLRTQWKLIGGILLVYGLLNILFVRGLGGGVDIGALKTALKNSDVGSLSGISGSFAIFGALIGTGGTTNSDVTSAYQSFLTVLGSMALIWGLRRSDKPTEPQDNDVEKTMGFSEVRHAVRDAYYAGTAQFVPFILVLIIIALQLVPLLLGSGIYGTVAANSLAVSMPEQIIWIVILGLLALLSLYFLSSSLFAMYIVTLPGMTPLRAIRTARRLTKSRRWNLMRKIILLPIAVLLLLALLFVPVILWAPPIAGWLFFIASLLVLAQVHSYMYQIYREML